jgi:hypothetical protein
MLVEGEMVWNVAWGFHFDHDEEGGVVMAAHSPMLYRHEGGKATDGEPDAAPLPEVKRKFLEGEACDVSVGEDEAVIALIMRLDVHENKGVVDIAHPQWAPLESCDMVTAAEKHGIAGTR